MSGTQLGLALDAPTPMTAATAESHWVRDAWDEEHGVDGGRFCVECSAWENSAAGYRVHVETCSRAPLDAATTKEKFPCT